MKCSGCCQRIRDDPWHFVGTIFLICGITLIFYVMIFSPHPYTPGFYPFPRFHNDPQFEIMIDAGSVHTSMSVYKSRDSNVEQIFACEISGNQGITMVKPENVESFLFDNDCMKKLETGFSENVLEEGRMTIGGTAGFRELRDKGKLF